METRYDEIRKILDNLSSKSAEASIKGEILDITEYRNTLETRYSGHSLATCLKRNVSLIASVYLIRKE